MSVDEKTFRRAKRGNTRAAIAVMSDCYVQVHRLAFALSGRDDVGRGIVRFVMRRGIRQLAKWTDESDPPRWCRHHTLLTTRRAIKHAPDPAHDTLIRASDEPHFISFVRAIRTLPMQQREALILTHGEDWGIRNLAIAMDCSQEAAQIHIREATRALSELSGENFATFSRQLGQRYQLLAPREDLVMTNVQRNVRKYLWPRRVWRFIRLVMTIAILAVIALFVWKIYPKLVF